MMKSLVAYFSAEAGTTRKVAEDLAGMVDADLWEIKPMTPYTPADLKWTNPLARCNREKIGKKDVPIEGSDGLSGFCHCYDRYAGSRHESNRGIGDYDFAGCNSCQCL